MNQEKNEFFLKQIKLQKQRLFAFIPALGFVLGMLYAKTAGHQDRPWYIFVLVTIYLAYGLIYQSIVNAKVVSQTIESFIILGNKKVELSFFQPIFFKTKSIIIDAEHSSYIDRNSISKKNIFALDPTIEIIPEGADSKYFFFPSCFDNSAELEVLFSKKQITPIN